MYVSILEKDRQKGLYSSDPNFSDRYVWANSEQSDYGLHCLLFHLHLFDKAP